MLSTRLFPRSYSGQPPHIGHLSVAVDFLHQFIVELMGHFLAPSCPDEELSGIGKETAGYVGWRIGFLPCDNTSGAIILSLTYIIPLLIRVSERSLIF